MAKHSRRDFLKMLGATSAALSIPAKATPAELSPRAPSKDALPNIVLLLADDLSAPDLGSYGNEAIGTPNLDGLAQTSTRFTRAYAPSPQCSPTRASLLTGRSPHVTGASRLHAPALPEFPSIITMLKGAGYFTGAYRKTHQPLIEKQFDFYGDDAEPLESFFQQRPNDAPFFLWFGSQDPHRPYFKGAFEPPHSPSAVHVPDFLPDTEEVRKDLARYYDRISRFDKDCGTILGLIESQGLKESTLVIMTADNGMPFPRAKGTLYEAGIRMPLLIRWPSKIAQGSISDALVTLLDIPATIVDALGLEASGEFEGLSLLAILSGSQPREFIFAERNWHDNWDPMRCVVSERFKLIRNYRPEVGYLPTLDILESPSFQEIARLAKEKRLTGLLAWYLQTSRESFELYDIQADPLEQKNLAKDPVYLEVFQAHQRSLSDWMIQTSDFLPPPIGFYPGDYSAYQQFIDPLNGIAPRL
jgi:arylsulfatase A-like enzyme